MQPIVQDAGLTIPESALTLALQREQLIAGLRPAMLYPALEGDTQHERLPLPEGMESHDTLDGTFHFNPTLTNPGQIEGASSTGRLNTVLAMGMFSKSDIVERIASYGEPPIAVMEMSPEGIEVKAVWGTVMTAMSQLHSLEQSKTPGHHVFVTSPVHIIVDRITRRWR